MPEENTPVTPAAGAPAPAPAPSPEPTKAYTEAEIGAIITRKKAEGAAEVLKELGVPSVDDAKKAAAAAKEATDKLIAAEARALAAELKADSLSAGIDPKKVDRAVKIIATYDGKTSADKVKAFLDENPEFKTSAEKPSGFGGAIKNQGTDAKAAAAEEVKKAFGLK